MSKTNRQLIESFARNPSAERRNGNLSIRDCVLYSYEMPIAVFDSCGGNTGTTRTLPDFLSPQTTLLNLTCKLLNLTCKLLCMHHPSLLTRDPDSYRQYI